MADGNVTPDRVRPQVLHESSAGLVVRAHDGDFEDGAMVLVRRWQPLTRNVCFERAMRVKRLDTLSRGGQFHVTHGPNYGAGDFPAEWGDTDYELLPEPGFGVGEGETAGPAFEIGRPTHY
jgi:hypothetical protein